MKYESHGHLWNFDDRGGERSLPEPQSACVHCSQTWHQFQRVPSKCVPRPVFTPKAENAPESKPEASVASQPEAIKCIACGAAIYNSDITDGRKKRKTYCSSTCANKARYENEPDSMLSPSGIGAWAEMIVAADLLRRGFHVFRAISPSCPCDLIALKGGISYRVEVTKGRRKSCGGHDLPPHDPLLHDMLAVVFHDGVIIYSPFFDAIVDSDKPPQEKSQGRRVVNGHEWEVAQPGEPCRKCGTKYGTPDAVWTCTGRAKTDLAPEKS